MPQLELYCFGPPRLQRDRSPVEVNLRKSMALLIYLAVTKQPHTRDALATLLWPEEDSRASRARLRRILYDLNRVLGEGHLQAVGESLQLNPQADLWLDTEEFHQSLAECLPGEGAPEGNSTPECLARLARAIELYSAEFLAGFTLPDSPLFDEWQFFEGETLRQSLARALIYLAKTHQQEEEWEQAVGYARRWLSLDPLHEPAHRCLMELYTSSGQVSAALRQYEICVQTLDRELGVSPEPETSALYEKIRTHSRLKSSPVKMEGPEAGLQAESDQPAAVKPRHNLPSYLTPLIGRREELVEIHRLLTDQGIRLLSLTGPGGIGKTRLALQAALDLLEDEQHLFPDGVYFIPLAPLSSPEAVLPAVARSLNFSFSKDGDRPVQQLLDYLQSKQMLLLLDNFEHLIDESSLRLPIDILAAAPGIKILITSRARLNVQGEHLFLVSGLRVPEPSGAHQGQILEGKDIEDSAVHLFQQSARRTKPGFRLTAENLPHILRICQLVQGMPLGIELASAWIEVLSPAEIAAEIERSLDFLEAGWQDLPERQQSLRAVFEGSWKLLTPAEREVFQTLSIFRGGFSRQAAYEIAGASPKLLLALMHKSWLKQNEQGRFEVHELLRQYAEETLQADPSVWQEAVDAHSAYYARFVKEQGERMKGPDQKEAFEAVAADFENIRAAWRCLVEGKQADKTMDMLYGLYRFATARSMGFHLLPEVQVAYLAFTDDSRGIDRQHLLASLLTIIAKLHSERMEIPFGEDKEVVRMAWELASEPGVQEAMGFWSVLLAERYAWAFDREQGVQKLLEMLPNIRQQGDAWTLAYTLSELGTLQRALHRPEEAHRNLMEALALHRQAGTYDAWSSTLRSLGRIAIEQGSFDEAERFLESARELAEKSGDLVEKTLILWQTSDLQINQGRIEEAFNTYREIRRIAADTGMPHMEAASFSYESIDRLRYADIEQALECRRQSLAISEKIGDPNGIAWSYWETGEIYRVAGDLERARTWYGSAFELFQEHHVDIGIAFYHRGLGNLAQSQGDFDGAMRYFQESLQRAQAENFDWSVSYSLSGLGRAALELGQFDLAREYIYQALELAQRIGSRGLAMVALAGIARLMAVTGESRQALQLSAFVLNQPTTWRETRAGALQVLEAAAAELPGEIAEETRASGAAADFTELVGNLLT